MVERAAADASGPSAGTPVVTLGHDGAWAELRAVDTAVIGAVPDGADPGAISTVPVAGASALRALRRIGPLLGKRVLVTGATGGVGHDRSLVTFYLLDGSDLVPDLTWLAARVAVGDLDPGIAWRGGWERADEAIAALLGRRLHGKAVLDVKFG
ncbi:hypothetical protein [Nonomuraea aridisoli]|uniref:hypothetical protein n=1 Tax=Nonomuraea aridisoli TaxID=2070368 RepID=UPI001F366291|nr:hypothetical protein [Nonomuraea aridisoli]